MQLTLFENKTENSEPSLFGKMSQVCYQQKITHSGAFWEQSPEKTYQFSRQGKNGQVQVLCLDKNAISPGAPLMLNFSECPNDAVESSLSQVIEKSLVSKKILFEPESVCWNIKKSTKNKQTLPVLLQHALVAVSMRQEITIYLAKEE